MGCCVGGTSDAKSKWKKYVIKENSYLRNSSKMGGKQSKAKQVVQQKPQKQQWEEDWEAFLSSHPGFTPADVDWEEEVAGQGDKDHIRLVCISDTHCQAETMLDFTPSAAWFGGDVLSIRGSCDCRDGFYFNGNDCLPNSLFPLWAIILLVIFVAFPCCCCCATFLIYKVFK